MTDKHSLIFGALILAMPVLLKSSKVATQEGYLEWSADESPFKKLCSYVVPALVKALSKVISTWK